MPDTQATILQDQIDFYSRFVDELGEHYDERLDRITVFSYSEALADQMHVDEVFDPDQAYALYTEIVDELLDERAALAA